MTCHIFIDYTIILFVGKLFTVCLFSSVVKFARLNENYTPAYIIYYENRRRHLSSLVSYALFPSWNQLGPYIFRHGICTKKNMFKLVSTKKSYTMNGVNGKCWWWWWWWSSLSSLQDEGMAVEHSRDMQLCHTKLCVLLFVTFML